MSLFIFVKVHFFFSLIVVANRNYWNCTSPFLIERFDEKCDMKFQEMESGKNTIKKSQFLLIKNVMQIFRNQNPERRREKKFFYPLNSVYNLLMKLGFVFQNFNIYFFPEFYNRNIYVNNFAHW